MTLSEEEVELLKSALAGAIEALNCWTCIHADDMCSEKSVREAKQKVYEYGTLSYISSASAPISQALTLLREKVAQ
jgi:hypothetical protein